MVVQAGSGAKGGGQGGGSGKGGGNAATWSPGDRGVELIGDAAGGLLAHPTNPLVVPLDSGSERELWAVGRAYLGAILRAAAPPGGRSAAEVLGLGFLPERFARSDLPPSAGFGFDWLSLGIEARRFSPGSFEVGREGAPGERQVVLVAGNVLVEKDDTRIPLGAGIGLAMTLRVTAGQALVTAMRTARLEAALADDAIESRVFEDLGVALGALTAALGLDALEAIEGVELGRAGTAGPARPLRLSGVGRSRGRFVRFATQWDPATRVLVPLALREVIAHALPKVFERDPASSLPMATRPRPARAATLLDTARVTTTRIPLDGRLEKAQALTVRRSMVLDRTAKPDVAVVDPAGADLGLRGGALGAAQAWLHGLEFFERIGRYGLSTAALLRQVTLPLVVLPRATLRGAADRPAFNAEVRPHGADLPAVAAAQDAGALEGDDALEAGVRARLKTLLTNWRPQLEIRLGCLAPTHRSEVAEPRQDGRRRSQHMGLAADARWMWHELGHVLAFGATGELEFRFAHSVGDALAAITGDPDSRAADEAAHAADPAAAAWRFQTFPFAGPTRRHDRRAEAGWCWCGRRSAMRRRAGDWYAPRVGAAYFEEQLLSSSLFRAYLALGGATPGGGSGLRTRRAASDYLVYLVMRGTALLPHDAAVPSSTIDDFVHALQSADLATGLWHVKASWPERPGPDRTVTRMGGWAHKVLRWAFEQQGLRPGAGPDEVFEGPGQAPRVDLFIAQIGRPDGGYAPVPLRWGQRQPWHAQAISVDGNGVHVAVGNRGRDEATDVAVRAWWRPAQGSAKWVPLPALGTPPAAVPGDGGLRTFSFDRGGLPPGQPVWLFADASCPDDRSHVDAALQVPVPPSGEPPRQRQRLIELVSGDNNCALVRYAP